MAEYKGYPLVVGNLKNPSNLLAKCPYCGRIEHFNYSKSCKNPTKRKSHCLSGDSEFYYIYIKRKEVKKDGRE